MTYPPVERNDESAEFFAAAARGELSLRRCTSCHQLRAARRRTCRACASRSSTLVASAGSGTLVTWARHPQADQPAWDFGIVELDEGPWLEARLVDAPAAGWTPGASVGVRFVQGETGDAYPAFAPTTEVAPGGRR